MKTITIEGKEIKISDESFEALKKQFSEVYGYGKCKEKRQDEVFIGYDGTDFVDGLMTIRLNGRLSKIVDPNLFHILPKINTKEYTLTY